MTDAIKLAIEALESCALLALPLAHLARSGLSQQRVFALASVGATQPKVHDSTSSWLM